MEALLAQMVQSEQAGITPADITDKFTKGNEDKILFEKGSGLNKKGEILE